jgi:TonB family protein
LRTFILSSILLIAAITQAQNSPTAHITVNTISPNPHIVQQASPVYPSIAKAAHISGQVKLQIEIDIDGHVTNTKVLSGPPMLVSSAQDCVKRWLYEPVLRDGKPTPASTIVTVSFNLPAPANPNDEQIASRFFPLQRACMKAVSTNIDPAQQAETCKQAAGIAQTFSSQERFLERRSAFVYASTALLRNKQLKEALDYSNKAVSVVEQGHDDGAGSSAAYCVRGQANAQLGNLVEASDDLTKAEDFEQNAIVEVGGITNDFVKHQYVPVLKGMLNFHAQILSALGKTKEAEAKVAEAAKL